MGTEWRQQLWSYAAVGSASAAPPKREWVAALVPVGLDNHVGGLDQGPSLALFQQKMCLAGRCPHQRRFVTGFDHLFFDHCHFTASS